MRSGIGSRLDMKNEASWGATQDAGPLDSLNDGKSLVLSLSGEWDGKCITVVSRRPSDDNMGAEHASIGREGR
jgi:hypothetical protein